MTSPSYPIRFVRTPLSLEPFTINWQLAASDAIATSVWTCDPGISIANETMTATTTTVWIADGPVPTGLTWFNYHAVNKITTNLGIADERTIVLFTKQL